MWKFSMLPPAFPDGINIYYVLQQRTIVLEKASWSDDIKVVKVGDEVET